MDLSVLENLENDDDKNAALIILLSQLDDFLDRDIDEFVEKFKNIYDGEYRHKYSDITGIVLGMEPGYPEHLLEFLKEISSESSKLGYQHSVNSIGKLIDHITLELTRSRYMDEKFKISEFEEKIKDDLCEIRIETGELNDKIKDSINKIKNSESQFITILGIFSSIVMVFFGGLNFASNTFQNVNNISIYRLIFVICLTGFIMFNCIFILLYFVSKFTYADIKEKCNKCTNEIAMTCYSVDDNRTKIICNGNCSPSEKFKNLYPVIFYVDSILVVCMVAIFNIWAFKNKKIIDIIVLVVSVILVELLINRAKTVLGIVGLIRKTTKKNSH